MAIARDSYAVSTGASGTTNTLSFNNVAGDFLVAFVQRNVGTDVHVSCTYNSVSMTYLSSFYDDPTVSNDGVDVYYLIAPATGTNNLVGTISGSSVFMQVWGVTYSGAKQSSQPDGSDMAPGNIAPATSYSSNITSTASNCWVVALGHNRSAMSSAIGTGIMTKVLNDEATAAMLMDSNGTVTAGSNAYGFSGAGLNSNSLGGVSIAPATGVQTVAHNLSTIGAGI